MASLRALECLVAVADTASITKAAQLLRLSQPAVSHQLASLEREARTALLRREPRGVTLTLAGRAALPAARRAVEAAELAVRAARTAGEATGGALRVGCAQSLTVPLLAPVIRDWHRRYPDVDFTLHESTSRDELLDLLRSADLDVLVIPGSDSDASTTTVVADEEIVLVTSSSHALAAEPTVALADLDGARLVHYAPENAFSGWLDELLARAGARPDPVMRTAITSAAPQLAAAGLGAAVCPVSAISAGLPGSVRSFTPRLVRQLVAVTPVDPDPLAARFVAQLRRRGLRIPPDVRRRLDPTSVR